jgi:OOP family OmpA-OmpF porin
MKIAHTRLPAALIAAWLFLTAGPLCAAPGDQPVAPLPAAAKPDSKINTRTASLPARGLFVGDKLSDSAKSRLVDLIINAIGLDVEVALLVPVGPWEIDGGGHTDHDLTAARLQSLRKFLTERGIEPRKIFVESRVDPKVTEPRLDVQLVGTPAND